MSRLKFKEATKIFLKKAEKVYMTENEVWKVYTEGRKLVCKNDSNQFWSEIHNEDIVVGKQGYYLTLSGSEDYTFASILKFKVVEDYV